MRKKNISVVMMWILIMSSMLIGCGNKPTASLLDGTYKIIENQEELLVPAVSFDTKEKEFQFSFDALSSYINIGTYKINGDNT
ncbi:MAG: hypothetical protein EOM40_10760 [Clostridia bacterium]|nr:hypothetical protein [Clostridia bacterium]